MSVVGSFNYCAEHAHRHRLPYCVHCIADMFVKCKAEDHELDDLFAAAPSPEEQKYLERRDRCNEMAYQIAVYRQLENQRYAEQTNWPHTTVENTDPQHVRMEQVRATCFADVPFSR